MLAAQNIEKRAQTIVLSEDGTRGHFKCEKCRKVLNKVPIHANNSLLDPGLYRHSCTSCKTINYYRIEHQN